MKVFRVLGYIFGSIFIFLALILFLTLDWGSIMAGISFLLIAVVLFPTLWDCFRKKDIRFSVGRKIFMAIVPLFICPFFPLECKYYHFLIYFIIVSIYWFIMIITNRKKYSTYLEQKENAKKEKEKRQKELKKQREEQLKQQEKLAKEQENKNEEQQEVTKAEINHEKEDPTIEVDNVYKDLNVMTLNVISKELMEIKRKHNIVVYSQDMPEAQITDLIIHFIEETKNFKNIGEFTNLFTHRFYDDLRVRYFDGLERYIKRKIKIAFPNLGMFQRMEAYNKFVNISIDCVLPLADLYLYNDVSITPKNFSNPFNGMKDVLKEPFEYMYSTMATATNISRVMFVDKKIKEMSEDNEFYKIVKNMSKEIKDTSKIIEKTRPVYDEFYMEDLGYISDDSLYAFAIIDMYNRINAKKLLKNQDKEFALSDKKITNIDELNTEMQKWIIEASKKPKDEDINIWFLLKIYNSIDNNNFELLLEALSKINMYDHMYYSQVKYNNKVSDKERYLKGDFSKEMKELSGRYSLNNIVTGPQFEMYLENLFNELGYKVKRSGKAGDQGADLILKKGNYIYAIQAKFYTGKLSNTPVQEITGALKLYNANQGVVVTNSEFTSGAKQLAKANDVILIDGKGLKKLTDYAMNNETNKDVLKDFE